MVNDGGAPDKRFLESIFKTDLHCHLGGSIRLKTLVELADEQSVPLPSKDIGKLKKTISPSEFRSLEEYLAAFTTTESVLRDPAALERVAYEVCEDAAKENVIYLELRFGPTNYETDDLSPQRVVSSVLDGMKRAEKDYSIKTGLILCGIRTELERTREAAELAVIIQGRGVVGFDLAGAGGDGGGVSVDARPSDAGRGASALARPSGAERGASALARPSGAGRRPLAAVAPDSERAPVNTRPDGGATPDAGYGRLDSRRDSRHDARSTPASGGKRVGG